VPGVRERLQLIGQGGDVRCAKRVASVADKGLIDAVIEPHQTRRQITLALRALRNKRVDLPTRKHGNIPL